MKHACQFLLKSDITIDQVAKSVGFMDEKHFRRTFKKDLGMTPGEYRKIQKSKK
jgi:AraC-like DNA-binding protein